MFCRMQSDGREVSVLGYGAMRLPTVDGGHANSWAKSGYSESTIDQEMLDRQIRYLLEHGVNYFDTSPAYCRGESESRLGEALAKSGFARKDYIIATKLSNFAPDNYLLHSIGNGGFETFSKRYLENGALDWCAELRREKRIRNLGFSFHGDPKAFEWCIEHHGDYKWDFCQIQMNYVDWRHAKEVNSRNLDGKYLYETLAERKIPVVIMEPLLGGTLARYNEALARHLVPLDPEASLAKWALRFCASFPNVMTILSGMTRTEHIEENVATFSPLKPCSEKELDAACSYCMPCPYGLDIPSLLRFRNDVLMKGGKDAKTVLAEYAKAVPEELRRADHCTGCGLCRPHCPQQINIPGEMAMIDSQIDLLKNEVARR